MRLYWFWFWFIILLNISSSSPKKKLCPCVWECGGNNSKWNTFPDKNETWKTFYAPHRANFANYKCVRSVSLLSHHGDSLAWERMTSATAGCCIWYSTIILGLIEAPLLISLRLSLAYIPTDIQVDFHSVQYQWIPCTSILLRFISFASRSVFMREFRLKTSELIIYPLLKAFDAIRFLMPSLIATLLRMVFSYFPYFAGWKSSHC